MKLVRSCDVAMILMVSGLALWPGVSFAEPDLDVTMRMVTDDDALSDSVVQQIQLPDPGKEAFNGGPSKGSASGPQAVQERGSHRQNSDGGDRGRHAGESIADRVRKNRDVIDKPQPHKPQLPGKPGIANGQ